jgi:hypothetical protein
MVRAVIAVERSGYSHEWRRFPMGSAERLFVPVNPVQLAMLDYIRDRMIVLVGMRRRRESRSRKRKRCKEHDESEAHSHKASYTSRHHGGQVILSLPVSGPCQ